MSSALVIAVGIGGIRSTSRPSGRLPSAAQAVRRSSAVPCTSPASSALIQPAAGASAATPAPSAARAPPRRGSPLASGGGRGGAGAFPPVHGPSWRTDKVELVSSEPAMARTPPSPISLSRRSSMVRLGSLASAAARARAPASRTPAPSRWRAARLAYCEHTARASARAPSSPVLVMDKSSSSTPGHTGLSRARATADTPAGPMSSFSAKLTLRRPAHSPCSRARASA
mmetsp:Transcript_10988/g.32637  ORF Transcript_10988/g.32637 Transcript_10988/m.32637 type:complete len:228 (+) Transcript_10988:353-1036(+)